METGILAGDQSGLEMESGTLPSVAATGPADLALSPSFNPPFPEEPCPFSFLGMGSWLAGGGGELGMVVMAGEGDITLGGMSQLLHFSSHPWPKHSAIPAKR